MSAAPLRGGRPVLPSSPGSSPGSSRDEAVSLLAPALGDDKARELVRAASTALGLLGDDWSGGSLRAVFDHIAKEPGLVGITARVVTRRLAVGTSAEVAPASGSALREVPVPVAPSSAGAPRPQPTKPWEAVSDLLGHALGEERAQGVVRAAVVSLGLGNTLTYEDALRVLEHIAREPGVSGIAARFAKTRLHLLSW